jgi:hypothetical protein
LLAPKCEVRKALVKRAEHVGDARSAKLLQEFSGGKGCTEAEPKPCNACLGPKDVKAALGAIAAREKSAKAAPKR